ncbi:MBL fold metallo-hydrolase [Kineosporia succinea]|uniref:Ribonuclease BN (tRNA processing enzyme) n=1 Tax=Kineosporia succinea TaxID=84632 RepID=A0ABT9NXX6_9ACTN|nr:MBL fold metallo-hydrolase [Kineosporia succinea]MDP9825277.1 ribonuclease BN (tRNA processing enzyme) [Kineosporia succinea]
MRLTIVGCSGSFPGPQSPSSSYLLEAEEAGRTWRVVLDLGSGALGSLQRFADPSALDAVIVSHLHPDHFMDLCGLFVARHYDPVGPPMPALPVYGPAGTADRVLAAYGPDAASELPHVYDVRELTDGGVIRIGPFTVTTRSVNHPVPAFGMRIQAGGASIAYSGDTDSCANLIELARGVDLFLSEASFVEGRDEARGVHLTGRRAGEAATEADVRRLVLTHIPVWTDTETVVREARGSYPGPVEAATTGAQYVLERVEAR